MNCDYRRLGIAVSLFCFSGMGHRSASAQNLNTGAPLTALPLAERLGQEVHERVNQGRTLLDANDFRAVTTLRDAAQSALVSLDKVLGYSVLSATPQSLPDDVITSGLAQRAAEAHYYWGLAADHFALRDESITALARAVRLSRAVSGPAPEGSTLRRDATSELGRVLRDGLPLTAPNDVLDAIASIAHGGLWKPHLIEFDPAPLTAIVGDAPPAKDDFLVTDGKVFPPIAPNGSLARTPPIYQDIADDVLPSSLRLDKMVAGYEKEADGLNKGQWRQIVRVFYASTFMTTDKRDDLPRAQSLCEQFLKIHSLFQDNLGATNLYARGDKMEGITTLWLLEVSALWPQDDKDPAFIAQLGPLMPTLNVGPKQQATDPETTELSRPWTPISGQSEGNPGEVLFWKSSMARPEAEWVRELAHEYGHVALPPVGGFRPPLEPYGNGIMGETLGMMWAAQIPDFLTPPGANTEVANPQNALSDYMGQVNAQALPALQFFLSEGPNSTFRSAGNQATWRYLQGLTVYAERVYGGQMLGRALTPLANRAAGISNVAARRSLMNTQSLLDSMNTTWRDPWNGAKSLALWLPGALGTNLNGATLVGRGDVTIKVGATVPALLYIPQGTDSLRIDGNGAGNLRSVGFPFTNSNGAIRLYFGGKSGWQNFSLTAQADARISAARFEKK